MGEGRVRESGMDMDTLLDLTWRTSKDLLDSTGTLLHVMWQPGWEGSWGRMDACMWMAESLRCPPEALTTLLSGYVVVIQQCLTLRPHGQRHPRPPRQSKIKSLFFFFFK